MLQALSRLFRPSLHESAGPDVATDRDRACRIAGAALLVEMSRADYEVTPVERGAIERALRHVFELDPADADRALPGGGAPRRRGDFPLRVHPAHQRSLSAG